jgi:hypothetical protein
MINIFCLYDKNELDIRIDNHHGASNRDNRIDFK